MDAKRAPKRGANVNGGYILGLDLGVASVGWAKIPINTSQISDETLDMGARIFESPFEPKNGEPKNLARRQARQVRKGYRRTRRRMTKLFNRLRNGGLLPEGDASTPESRQEFLNNLDRQLFDKYYFNASHIEEQTFLYSLRARALDEKLGLDAVGRIFLHLAARRGYLSNAKLDAAKQGELGEDARKEQIEAEESKTATKSTKKSDKSEKTEKSRDDDGVVKTGIEELNKAMRAKKARTLGEFFADVNPEDKRIRTRYLGRGQIREEFDAIWRSQARFYPKVLTPKLRRSIERAIFTQRPLKSQRKRVGFCPLEWNSTLKRGPRCVVKGDPAFQEYRIWQFVLDLRIYENENESRELTPEEQDKIVAFLNECKTATCAKLSEVLGFKGKRKKDSKIGRFNFETDPEGEKRIYGNVTRTKIVETLTKYGVSKSDEEIDVIAREILVFGDERALARRLRKMFPEFGERVLPKQERDERDLAEALADVQLSTARASLSRRAAVKLTEAMKTTRRPLKSVELEIYGKKAQKVRDFLPPVIEVLGDPRNSVVLRTLSQTRQVVNAAIRRWGKPERIRVELSRDLKKSAKSCQKMVEEMNSREKERNTAAKVIKEAKKGKEATSTEILKYRLWLECEQTCPYTGDPISLRQLLGLEGSEQVDIEHIVPFSRSFDDSFANKTLCFAGENRNRKKNQTPFECYGRDEEKWNKILSRVKGKFKGRKWELFTQRETPKVYNMPSRMLNDTRYLSKLAAKYLGVLYGAVDGNDEQGTKRIQVTSGAATAVLRYAWRLNSLLIPEKTPEEKEKNEPKKKNRDDLRHHAVDALVIALADGDKIRRLAVMSAESEEYGKNWKKVEFPLILASGEALKDVVGRVVEGVIVSHRVSRKISGPLHKETNYRVPEDEKDARRAYRKPLLSFTVKQMADIVEPKIRKAVCEKWFELVRAKKFLQEDEAEKRKKFDELSNELLRLGERRDDVNKEFAQLLGQIEKLVGSKNNDKPLKGCEPDNWPTLPPKKRDGQRTPIKKARYWTSTSTIAVGGFKLEKRLGRKLNKKDERRLRYVESEKNNHMEVWAILDKNNNVKGWRANVVSKYKAYCRKRNGEPVVRRKLDEPKHRFLFSLAPRDALLMDGRLLIARSFSKYSDGTIEIECKEHYDGRKGKDGRVRIKSKSGNFMSKGLVKVRIDALGRVCRANE